MDEFNDIRDKFDDLEGTPPIGGWNRIKDQLPQRKRRPLFWLWIPFAAMFTGLVFLVGYYLGQSSIENQQSGQKSQTEYASGQTSNADVNVSEQSASQSLSEELDQNTQVSPQRNVTRESTIQEPALDSDANPVIALATPPNYAQTTLLMNSTVGTTATNAQSEPTNSETSEPGSIDGLNASPPSNYNDVTLLPAPSYPIQILTNDSEFPQASTILSDEPHLIVKVEPDIAGIPPAVRDPIESPGWELQVFASALYHRKVINTNPNDQVFIRDFVSQEGQWNLKTGFDAGFNVKRHLNSRFGVFGGLGISQLNDRVEYVVSEASEPEIQTLSSNSFSYSSNNTLRTRQIDIDITNATVNAGIEYYILPGVSVFSGFGVSKLISANPNEIQNDITDVNYYSFSGLSFQQAINSQIDLRIQPVFNYYFRDIIREEFDMKAMNYGLRLVLAKH